MCKAKCYLTRPAAQLGSTVTTAFMLLVGLLCGACSDYQFQSGTPSVYRSNQSPAATDSTLPLVGMAISGGGNRSALFSSYVLELLGSLPVAMPTGGTGGTSHPTSFLGTVGYISSVSGGSFSAAYFGMKGPGHYDALLSDGAMPKEYADFFNDFHAAMNANWEAALFGLKGLSFGSNATRLAKAIDQQFLDGGTFRDLDLREASRTSPYLIFNATHYDSGRRFVMTTIPSSWFCLNAEEFLKTVVYTAPEGQQSGIDARYIKKLAQCDRQDPLTPEGFDAFYNPHMTSVPSADFQLARAVATSASFPLAVGPTPFRIDDNKALLHLIDGGVADNTGIESLMQLFLRKLIENPTQRGVIISLNAGLPFNARGTAIAEDSSPLAALIHDPTRPSDIQEIRTSMYRQDLWEVTEAVAKNMKMSNNAVSRLSVAQLEPTDLNVSSLNIQTNECREHFDSAQSVRTAVRDIPTNFHLDACSAQLVRISACWSVHRHASAIQQLFEQAGGDNRRQKTGTDILDKRIKAMCPELAASL